MTLFDTIKELFNIIWTNVGQVPILNTGLCFKDVFFGFIGLSVFSFLFSSLFGFGDKVSYGVGNRSKNEAISDNRRYDER